MTLTDGQGVNLSRQIPAVDAIHSADGFYTLTNTVKAPAGNKLSEWSGKTAPSKADCLTQTQTNPKEPITLREGLEFCVSTSDQRTVAYVKIDSVENGTVRLDITVWGN